MQINTFLLTAGFIALGSADSSSRTFTSAGTANKGFVIPENLPEGVYTVAMDRTGKARQPNWPGPSSSPSPSSSRAPASTLRSCNGKCSILATTAQITPRWIRTQPIVQSRVSAPNAARRLVTTRNRERRRRPADCRLLLPVFGLRLLWRPSQV